MLNKNLTYTAITRAKKKLILCGNPNVFYKSIEPTNVVTRQTALEWFFTTDREAEIQNIELEEIKENTLKKLGKDKADIFEGHITLLEDEELFSEIDSKISEKQSDFLKNI